MALKLNTAVTNDQGLTIPNAYVRLTVIDGPKGDSLYLSFQYYVSKESFDSKKSDFRSLELDGGTLIPYDRNKDGVDTLAYGHQEAVKYFAENGIDATILLDSLI